MILLLTAKFFFLFTHVLYKLDNGTNIVKVAVANLTLMLVTEMRSRCSALIVP